MSFNSLKKDTVLIWPGMGIIIATVGWIYYVLSSVELAKLSLEENSGPVEVRLQPRFSLAYCIMAFPRRKSGGVIPKGKPRMDQIRKESEKGKGCLKLVLYENGNNVGETIVPGEGWYQVAVGSNVCYVRNIHLRAWTKYVLVVKDRTSTADPQCDGWLVEVTVCGMGTKKVMALIFNPAFISIPIGVFLFCWGAMVGRRKKRFG